MSSLIFRSGLPASSATLEDVYVLGRAGQLIPLRSLITLKRSAGPAALSRTDQMNSALLGGEPSPGHTVQEASAELRSIAESVLPANVRLARSAALRAAQQAAAGMLRTLVLAIVFIYLVLAAQFENFRDPVIILAVVPIAICGALIGLFLYRGTIDTFSAIGLIALVGLIAKHGILVVEFTRQLREQGQDLHDALIDAATLRLRPILMTTIATVLGALPLALATGAGAGGRAEIGIVITAGMVFGSLVSLFLLPAVYSLLARRSRRPQVPVPDFLVTDQASRKSPAE